MTYHPTSSLLTVLEYVLQHSDLPHDSGVYLPKNHILRLLCTSPSIRRIISTSCAGRVALHLFVTPDRAQQFECFMAKQGHLVRSLNLSLPDALMALQDDQGNLAAGELDLSAEAAEELAEAAATELAAAAALKHATRLQHLRLTTLCPTVLVQVSIT